LDGWKTDSDSVTYRNKKSSIIFARKSELRQTVDQVSVNAGGIFLSTSGLRRVLP
jgi:hypothetical protein